MSRFLTRREISLERRAGKRLLWIDEMLQRAYNECDKIADLYSDIGTDVAMDNKRDVDEMQRKIGELQDFVCWVSISRSV